MQSLINGQQTNLISIADRGFQYGDGCFETVRMVGAHPVLLDAHLSRLDNSCQQLGIPLQLTTLIEEIEHLLLTNCWPQAVLKITVTRGVGGRGYRPEQHAESTRIVQLFEYPPAESLSKISESGSNIEPGVSVILCQHKLSSNCSLAGMKHLNRLDQVLASREIPEQFAEGLCMDQSGHLIEGCKSNLILVKEGRLITPDLSDSGVNGIMLQYLLDRFREDGVAVETAKIAFQELEEAGEVFLCNSVFGVWPVIKLSGNDTVFSWPVGPKTQQAIHYKNEIFNAAS